MIHSKKVRLPLVADIIRKIIVSWLLAVLIEYIILPPEMRGLTSLAGLAEMSLIRVAVITVLGTVLLTAVSFFVNTSALERFLMLGIFASLAGFSLSASSTYPFSVACIIILAILFVFALRGYNSSPDAEPDSKPNSKMFLYLTAGLTAGFFIFASAWTVGRYLAFMTPTYDFGIFAQMFHSMKESGLPITTVERDGALSHFAVHMSPIYYLMLPFYCLFPSPITLQVLQAAIIASAVIPLWKLGRHHGLSSLERFLICALLLLYPAFMGGIGYDLHENCFLTPLILWLLYGIDRGNIAITAAASVLTLTVKEDAAVYVAVIAIWLIVKSLVRKDERNPRNLITGAALLAVSIAYFFAVTGYLAESGDGVMTYRYGNFMYGESDSLITVIFSVIMCPMKAVFECVDPEKLKFIALTLIPLLAFPLITRRYERYILLIPYLLVNLMSDYQYQHDIFFQYCFGSTALLLYLTLVNLADLKLGEKRTIAMLSAIAISAGCFGAVVYPKGIKYPQYARDSYEYYESVRDTLDLIPDGASVAATTYYTAYLSARDTLYDIKYASREHLLECEYVVLKLSDKTSYTKYATGGKDNGYRNLVNLLVENGYEEYAELQSTLVIWRKTTE